MKIKVVIFGEGDSGKSTLVRHFIPGATSVEAKAKDGHEITVALDFGKINISGYTLHFFGTPGQHRFEFARKIVAQGAHIGILLIDSEVATNIGVTDREIDIEKEMLDKPLPHVICANKRDVPGVVTMDEIQGHFKSEVLPITATTGEGVGRLMEVMFDLIEDFYGEPEEAAAAPDTPGLI